MAFKMNHIHLKTPDPHKTAQFYADSLGAKIVGEAGNGGVRMDLHGLSINVTKFIDGQTREQLYGIEHIAIDTDDLDNVVASLKEGGARILEETRWATAAGCVSSKGRRACSSRSWRWCSRCPEVRPVRPPARRTVSGPGHRAAGLGLAPNLGPRGS